LFVLTTIPYGVVGAFTGLVMPYLAEQAGFSPGEIGVFGTILLVPTILQFLYAPIVDIGPRRKHWLVIVAAVGAACLTVSCLMPLPERKTEFLAFAFVAQTISGLVGSCGGGLMAMSMPDHLRGRASGWYNVGNLSGGALSASIGIWMVGHKLDPLAIGLTLAAMMVIPALAALWIDEPQRARRTAGEVFRETLGDVGHVLFSKTGLTGIALCISPVGTAALVNYFTGMTKAYGVSADTVAILTGVSGTALTALGAGVGGYLCDRFNRRALYLLSGTLTALCGIVMAVSPTRELTYVAGVATYALITGFCYSAFTSTVLETIGTGRKAAATQYSLFVAAGNTAITYVGFVDTRFANAYGVNGVIASDAALNLLGVVVLAIVFWRLGSFGKWRHPKQPSEPAPASEPAAELPTATAQITERDGR
jgi:MFS family permease